MTPKAEMSQPHPRIMIVKGEKADPSGKAATKRPEIQVERFADPQRRSWRGVLSFLALVLLPLGLWAGYLWNYAADRYETGFSFSVRSQTQQTPQASAMAAMMGGGGAASDAGVLADFITSREMAARITSSGVDLAGMFSVAAKRDPLFSLRHPEDPEKLAGYWQRAVSSERDPQTGIVRVKIDAFSAADAKIIADAAMNESRKLVDELSAQARADVMRASEDEVARAQADRDAARKELSDFRVANAIVDPEVSLAGRVKTIDELRAELDKELLARAEIESNSRTGSTRLEQSNLRIRNLEERLAQRTAEFGDDAGYARIASRYEDLQARAEFSEITLRNAMTMRDAARKEADMRAAYLTAHVLPHEPTSPVHPRRAVLTAVAAAMLIGVWLLGRLIFIAVRERH